MTFFYVVFGLMFAILLVGTILEDRRHTQMEQTVKAILARNGGDRRRAMQYCLGVAKTATNPDLKREYLMLADAVAEKTEAAHVS